MPIPSQTGSGSLGRGWTPGATRPACMSGSDGNRTHDILLAKRRRTIRDCLPVLALQLALRSHRCSGYRRGVTEPSPDGCFAIGCPRTRRHHLGRERRAELDRPSIVIWAKPSSERPRDGAGDGHGLRAAHAEGCDEIARSLVAARVAVADAWGQPVEGNVAPGLVAS